MAVTDEQVATLRALMSGDFEEYDRLKAEVGQSTDRRAYTALGAAAFFKAATQRFAKEGAASDVVEFVADVRSRTEEAADQIDPRTAERILLAVVGEDEDDLDDLDSKTRVATQFTLLVALVADQDFDEAGLDAFLGEARGIAEEWMN